MKHLNLINYMTFTIDYYLFLTEKKKEFIISNAELQMSKYVFTVISEYILKENKMLFIYFLIKRAT